VREALRLQTVTGNAVQTEGKGGIMKTRTAIVAVAAMLLAGKAMADTFGVGGNMFSLDFVTISGLANPAAGYGIVDNDYRVGVHEVTNDQWNKFAASLGVPVTGNPSAPYDGSPQWLGTDVPTNMVSWHEMAQFVNWLNTSTGHPAAYRFTGTQGTADYTLATWSADEAEGGTNLYRHKDAFYYAPTEDEWVKAAYWNGTSLQTYATVANDAPQQGDGSSGSGWNYRNGGYATDPFGPWAVGSGSEELNGTYDMMGNVYEWMESPQTSGDYGAESRRALRGGSYQYTLPTLASSSRSGIHASYESYNIGFRVASDVPEPATLALLVLGGLTLLKRRRK
jgi:formylglycine-generating enzyme required for sulfatase activity